MFRFMSYALICLIVLANFTGCPLNTPADPVLSKIIVGTWMFNGEPAHFNNDGTYDIPSNGLAGTYEIFGNAVILIDDDFEPGRGFYLLFLGIKDGQPIFTEPAHAIFASPV